MGERTYIAAVYRGIEIWFNVIDRTYFFMYAGKDFLNFTTLSNAEAFIDTLLAPPPTPPEVVPPAPTPVPTEIGLPWYLSWVQDALNWWGGLWQGFLDWGASLGKAIGDFSGQVAKGADTIVSRIEAGAIDVGTAITGLPGALMGALVEGLGDVFKKGTEESISQALKTISEVTGATPEWKKELDSKLEPYGAGVVAETLKSLSPEALGKSPLTAEEAAATCQMMMVVLTGLGIGTWIVNAAAEAATLGQLEAVGRLEEMVLSKLGLNQLGARALMIPLEELVFKRAQQHWAAQYTPEIPATTDLISMVVKEVITIDQFKQWMKFKGFNPDWSQSIWDAHFIAPTLTDLLTAWRRGLITEEELDKLMILVDLDPRYKEIFDTRKYITPPVSMTRFMFETGAIGPEDVRRNVALEGYRPEDVDKITNFIVGFQARRWRIRYLQALSTGYTKGVVSEGELEKSVVDAGYTEETAHWIVETSKMRAKVTGAAAAGKGEKLLSTSELKRLYTRNLINVDALRNELMARGYNIGDVDLLVKMLDEEKVVEAAGGAKVALSVPENMNAWRYGEMTEDELRIELQLRGLSLTEVDRLINTKKKQWEMGGVPTE